MPAKRAETFVNYYFHYSMRYSTCQREMAAKTAKRLGIYIQESRVLLGINQSGLRNFDSPFLRIIIVACENTAYSCV